MTATRHGSRVRVAAGQLTANQARALAVRLNRLADEVDRARRNAGGAALFAPPDYVHPSVQLAAQIAGVDLADVYRLHPPRPASQAAQLAAYLLVTVDGVPVRVAAQLVGRSYRQTLWMVSEWRRRVRINPDLRALHRRAVHQHPQPELLEIP